MWFKGQYTVSFDFCSSKHWNIARLKSAKLLECISLVNKQTKRYITARAETNDTGEIAKRRHVRRSSSQPWHKTQTCLEENLLHIIVGNMALQRDEVYVQRKIKYILLACPDTWMLSCIDFD